MYRFEKYADDGIKVRVENKKFSPIVDKKAVEIKVSSWGACSMNILDIKDEEERRETLKHYEVYILKALEYANDFDCDVEVKFDNYENPEKGTKTGVIVALPTDNGFKIALTEWTDRSCGSIYNNTYKPFFGNSSYTVYPRFYDHYIGENPIMKLAGKVTGIRGWEGGQVTFNHTCSDYVYWTVEYRNENGVKNITDYKVTYDAYTGYDLE